MFILIINKDSARGSAHIFALESLLLRSSGPGDEAEQAGWRQRMADLPQPWFSSPIEALSRRISLIVKLIMGLIAGGKDGGDIIGSGFRSQWVR
jgi:hypothetical protein